jgi:serine protease Do
MSSCVGCGDTLRTKRLKEGTRHRGSARRAALGGVLAALLVGCGGQTKAVTGDPPGPASTPAASTTTAVSPVAGSVTAKVKRSVLPVSCSGPDGGNDFVGSGFRMRNGVVTASHVVAACPPGTTISFGNGNWGTVWTDDPSHDLALVLYQSPNNPAPNTEPDPKPLPLESRPAYVGEPLVLLGFPSLPVLGNPFKHQVAVAMGNVVATNHAQALTSAEGARETLRDAIEVAVPGVVPGQSGGPAIDSAGKVVGVIEGSASGIASLAPVADLTSLH